MSENKNDIDFSMVLASSVHDMKNSIGMLVASIESIVEAQPPEDPEQAKRFNTLQYEASRINGELVQLLTIYRMQNNRLLLQVDHHFVFDLLEEQVARNHGLIQSREIDLHLVCDPDLQWYLDADLVGSVVQNVMVNCSRYTKRCIQINATVIDGMLCITVADDGNGYPESMLKDVGLESTDGNVSDGSTQLGLYFAQRIAEVHKNGDKFGYVKLENGEPLGGGVFKMYLP